MARFEQFWDVVCDFRQYIWIGVMFCLFLLGLSVISLVLAPPGTASQYLAIVNFVLLLVLTGLVGGTYWVCLQGGREYY